LPAGNARRSRSPPRRSSLLVAERPDLTIEELRGRLAASGLATSRSALGRFLSGHGLTRKKDPARRRAGSPGRRRGARRLTQPAAGDERERLVFVGPCNYRA
jgi:hypothetical protein